jgi:magnesium-transporting ATPase (P-type)
MITGDNPATAAAVGRMAGAFMGPDQGPTLLLDGEGTAEDPLMVADMSTPENKTTLVEYLRSFFPHDHIHMPAEPSKRKSSSRLISGMGVNHKELKEEDSAASFSLSLFGPHDLVVSGRAFDILHRAHEDRYEEKKIKAPEIQIEEHHQEEELGRYTYSISLSISFSLSIYLSIQSISLSLSQT